MGIAIGGSHGIFTNPGKAVGRIFSLKNLVPDITTAVGSTFGPVGAGLGSTAGSLLEGKNFEQSALGGVEAGIGDYGFNSLGGTVGNALQGTMLGNALGSVGGDISGLGTSLGITGPGGLTSDIAGLGNNLGITGPSGLTSDIMGGFDTAGKDLGITGQGGLTSDISSGWNHLVGPSTAATGAAAAIPSTANTFAPGFGAGNLPLTPSNVSGTGGGGILGNLFGGGGGDESGGGKGLFGGSPALGLLAAAPVALQALRGTQPYKGETQLQQSAAQLGQQGTQLQNYLQTGTLPPGAQAAINQATASAQAAIRSQYAAMGMSGSSAEAQDLAAAQQQGAAQGTNMAMQLLNSGIQSSQMSDQLYQDIMNQSMQQDQDLSAAIGNFASMAGGGTGGNSGSTRTAA